MFHGRFYVLFKMFHGKLTISWVNMFHVKHYLVSIVHMMEMFHVKHIALVLE